MGDDEFEQQLAQEALEKARAELSGQSDPYTHVDPNDGTVYEWDHQRKAWFPKITEDFLASYHANYGNFEGCAPAEPVPEVSAEEKTTAPAPKDKSSGKPGEKRKPPDPAWFDVDDHHNTKVYVSGLPLDTTDDEFCELMSKFGLVMKDLVTNKYKLKLYRNKDGTLKGDGLCCYIRIESVELALKILDGSKFKNSDIHVERAKFQLKGEYDPSKKPRTKKAKEKVKLKKKLDKLFDWRPEALRGQRKKHESTVIIKNMFGPKEFDNEPRLILEYQQDIREECTKCGEVKKVVVYDRHPEGVVSVAFKEPEQADECILLMDRRWFAGRQLSADSWDGKTRYKVEETDQELEKRIAQWDSFLEGEDAAENKPPTPESNAGSSSNGVSLPKTLNSSPSSELTSEPSAGVDERSKLSIPKQGSSKEEALTDDERHSDKDSVGSGDEGDKGWP